MNNGNLPELTKSIEEFIELGSTDDKTYSNFAVLAKCIGESSVLYAQDNVIYDYIKELKSSAVSYELTDTELIKYRYNPKRLSYDIYGSSELYFVILAVNGMCSFKDFNKKTIKILYRSDVDSLLTSIYNAESNFLATNRLHIKNETVES